MDIEKFKEMCDWLLSAKGNLSDLKLSSKHLKVWLKYFVVTKDEHDNVTPFKRLPYDKMPHISYMADVYTYENLICVAKSRQILMTWFWCAVLLWDTMFKEGRLNVIINQKEDAAEATIERCRIIYNFLPELIKESVPADKTPQGKLGAHCRLSFDCNGSMIKGLPQNPEAVRMNTASNLLIDEAAFIERADECYTAALPTVRNGGKMILNSTPRGQNFFCRIHNDIGDKI